MKPAGGSCRLQHALVRRLAPAILTGLVLLPCAFAQTPATSTGTSFATVTLGGEAQLGSTVSLRLSAPTLTFDLRDAGPGAPACVASSAPDGVAAAGRELSSFLGSGRVRPAGTMPRVVDRELITVDGGVAVEPTDWPLAPPGAAVVCYRSFSLFPFSNTDGWQLTVDRNDEGNLPGIEHLYLTATCGNAVLDGLLPIADQERVTLLGGMRAGSCGEALVVVAVKLGNESAGSAAAVLRYTLLSADALGER